MDYKYLLTPESISIQELKKNNCSFSSKQYKRLNFPFKDWPLLSDFLDRNLSRKDLGVEIGSENYIEKSPYFFVRTKALQEEYYTPEINSQSTLCIKPNAFVNMKLKAGDLIISKDSNIGEAMILDKDYPNHMLSGALYKLPIKINKYYLLACIKHRIFREQLDYMVPRSATIRHSKTIFKNCRIPMPLINKDSTIEYIELLTKSLINTEIEIRNKHLKIFESIEKELLDNQKKNAFQYSFPKISGIRSIGRFDTSLFTENFQQKDFLVKNYKNGYENLVKRGFVSSRGTSLEIGFIKTRIDSESFMNGFYKLVIPANISQYGTIDKITYIGTPTKLKTITKGEIIFGGEGFEKGRTFVVCEDVENIATNYHAIRLKNNNNNITESIFVRCFLAYWRSLGMIDYIGVGGSGGHCAPAYFHLINTPIFPDKQQNMIAQLYYNINTKYSKKLTLSNFESEDCKFNEIAGIYDLDKKVKRIKNKIDEVIDQIANKKEIDINFDFLN